MVGFEVEVEKINNITIGNPVVDIAQGACENKGKRHSFREGKIIDDDNVEKDTGDENRKKCKNVLGVLVPVEKAEYTAEIPRMDNRKE